MGEAMFGPRILRLDCRLRGRFGGVISTHSSELDARSDEGDDRRPSTMNLSDGHGIGENKRVYPSEYFIHQLKRVLLGKLVRV